MKEPTYASKREHWVNLAVAEEVGLPGWYLVMMSYEITVSHRVRIITGTVVTDAEGKPSAGADKITYTRSVAEDRVHDAGDQMIHARLHT